MFRRFAFFIPTHNDQVSIHRYDPASNTIIAVTALSATGGTPVVNESTGQVYVNTSAGVRVYSEDLTLITTLPLSIQAVNEVTNRLYFTTGGDIVILDGTSHAEIDRVTGVTGGVAVDTGSNEFFVSESGNALVLAYDGTTNAQIDSLSLGGAGVTTGVIVSDDAGRVYVMSFDAGAATLSALELVVPQAADLTVVGSADLTGDPTGAMAVNGTTDHVYLAGGFAQANVAVVDFTSLASPVKTVENMLDNLQLPGGNIQLPCDRGPVLCCESRRARSPARCGRANDRSGEPSGCPRGVCTTEIVGCLMHLLPPRVVIDPELDPRAVSRRHRERERTTLASHRYDLSDPVATRATPETVRQVAWRSV